MPRIVCPRSTKVKCLSTCLRAQNGETSKSAPESALGSTRGSTPISESTPESTLRSTFGGFPVLGSQAGRQTLDTKETGRRTEQAKANLDLRVAPRVGPRVAPRVRPRELISLFSALQGLFSGGAKRVLFGKNVFFPIV